jgi:ribonuclease HII
LNGRRFDDDARRRADGARLVGVDEAGRGPLAGPVVVAAVSLPEEPSAELCRARDSKMMTPKGRERLFGVVRSQALSVSVAWAHPRAIDRDNILAATLAAMGRAARRVAAKSGGARVLVLVDGPRAIRSFDLPQRTIVDGDAKSLSIAAASIVAKVVRDRWMTRLDRRHPGYGFAVHKGYGGGEAGRGGGAMTRIETGRKAEELAAAYLQAKGLTVIEKNFRAKVGEIDIVAKDGDEVVFVEVRARGSREYGGAAASVDGPKRRKLIRAAALWLQARNWDGACRFDVVAVDGGKLEHLPAAFDAGAR